MYLWFDVLKENHISACTFFSWTRYYYEYLIFFSEHCWFLKAFFLNTFKKVKYFSMSKYAKEIAILSILAKKSCYSYCSRNWFRFKLQDKIIVKYTVLTATGSFLPFLNSFCITSDFEMLSSFHSNLLWNKVIFAIFRIHIDYGIPISSSFAKLYYFAKLPPVGCFRYGWSLKCLKYKPYLSLKFAFPAHCYMWFSSFPVIICMSGFTSVHLAGSCLCK